ncbi:ABC transporter substrate-binding protein [Streptomyces sp. PTM05]|uniref:ABC transporter substrate-binding protein n=1 Tax=Streptantibioticus parmotrematis TaxID=2873249 RepID=A0ABS7QZR5_9ACTN|nr:ABC transporter substrate-binding protein [Streptantibioticus parmotrematis]MBY8888423.1 ABC transporter substrate-binding protein [Streptantibioticus parmotrematis]
MVHARTLRAALPFAAVALLAGACDASGSPVAATGATSNFSGTQVTTAPGRGQLSGLNWYGDYRAPYSEDPLKTADYPEETVLGNVCEPLLRTGADYSLHPGIAESWSQRDAEHLILDLDPRATFSDGHPVTTADVVYSLLRNQNPDEASNYADSYNDVVSVKATGTEQVTITFSKPDYLFVRNLGILAGAVVEKEFAVKAGQRFGNADTGVVCSGPYTIASFDGTNSMVLKRDPAYWDHSHAGKAATITFKFLSDPAAIANALTSGSLNGAFDLPPSTLSRLSKTADGKLYVGAAGSTTQNIDLIISRFTGAFADVRVRQALSLAIDRDGIARTLFYGAADPLYSVAGPGFWETSPAKSVYAAAYQKLVRPPDTGAATKLVKEAGATGKQITIGYAADSPTQAQIAQVLQQTGDSIGLKVRIVGLPDQQYGNLFITPKARAAYDSFLTINYLEYPEAANMYQSYAAKTGAQNFNGYTDPTVEADLSKAQGAQDPRRRAQYVTQAQAVLARALPWIPIVAPRALLFQNNDVTGAPLTFSYMDNAWAAAMGAP